MKTQGSSKSVRLQRFSLSRSPRLGRRSSSHLKNPNRMKSQRNLQTIYLSVEVDDCERSQVEKNTRFRRASCELHSAQSTCEFFFLRLPIQSRWFVFLVVAVTHPSSFSLFSLSVSRSLVETTFASTTHVRQNRCRDIHL